MNIIPKHFLMAGVAIIGIVALFAVLLAGFHFWQKQTEQKGKVQQNQAREQTLTTEEILEAPSAPSGNPPSTEEEKQEILEGLSVPSGGLPPTEEEKRAILEALSKPAQQ